jgi:PAS domain S-box-containing protein
LNITLRKEMEEALRKSENLYRAIGETIDYGVWVCDAQGRNTYASDSFLKLVGITQEQCSEFGWGDTLHPDDAERTIAAWKECTRSEGKWDIQHRFRGVDGQYHDVLARGVPIRDENGQVACWAGINLDISDLTAAQFELQQARDELEKRVQERTLALEQAGEALKTLSAYNRSLLEASLDPLVTITPDGKIGDVNAATELITGYSREELIGTDFHSYFTDPARARAGYQQVLEKGSVQHYLLELRHRDGHITTVLYNATVYRDESGEVRGVFAAARDITELMRSEWEIRRLNSELEQRVIERTAQLEEANQMLARAKNEADKANNAKSEFLSRVSHELRTPLNSILGFAQLMEIYSQKAQPGVDINPALQAKQDESLSHIVKAGSHLLDLINEVLEITRIETGRIPISPEPIRIDEIVNESIDLIRPLAAHKKLTIDLHIEEICGLYVMADRQRLKEVLLNLLSNAVKYNLMEGCISFVCQQVEGERLRFSVTDTGYGIAPEMLPRIFTPFERLGVEREGIEGTGLGLALSKGLVNSMGGEIGVESTLGVGSTFWVELPLTEGPLERVKRENGSRDLAEKPALTQKNTVLYIEDNLSNLNLIEHILEFRPETRLITAMRGGMGFELAREHQPNLILLDINMPDMPGQEVLQRLKADSLTRNIPVVVISADAMPGQIERLRQAGARDYLTKPLNVNRFIELLDAILGK